MEFGLDMQNCGFSLIFTINVLQCASSKFAAFDFFGHFVL